MMRLFAGRKKEEAKPPQVNLPEAILKNKDAISNLEKRHIHLERRIAAQEEEARNKAKCGDKRGALFSLKRKKMFEAELEQLGKARLTLEQQIITLESAQTQQIAVGALAAGVQAQKALSQQLNISKIDELIVDMQEQQDLQNELAQVLSQGNPMMDDSDLLAELNEIEAKQLEERLVDATPVPEGFPAIPTAHLEAARVPPVQVAAHHQSPPHAVSQSSSSSSRPLTDEEQLLLLQAELA